MAVMSVCGWGEGCVGSGLAVAGRETVRGVLIGDVPMTWISGSLVLVSCARASPAMISKAIPGGNTRVARHAASYSTHHFHPKPEPYAARTIVIVYLRIIGLRIGVGSAAAVRSPKALKRMFMPTVIQCAFSPKMLRP